MRMALTLAALLAAFPAAGEDCGRYAGALAYNACLARQGPKARAAHVGAAPARATGRRVGAARRNGRSEMVFSPGK
jgi:hypothetical protein